MEVNVGEILLNAGIQVFVSLLTVAVAYWLGRRQSDINWRRELAQREKEHQEQLEVLKAQLKLQEKDRRDRNAPPQMKWEI